MSNLLLRLCSLVAVLTLIGCGGGSASNEKQSKVSGKVTVNGAPVTGGSIIFAASGSADKMVTGTINADGTYEVNGVPLGDYTVAIDNSALEQAAGMPAGGAMPGMAATGKYVKINTKYYKGATSGLTVKIEKDKMTHDIDLK